VIESERVIAYGPGLIIWTARTTKPGSVAISQTGADLHDVTEILTDRAQLRWLAESGVPAALAALDQPDPATEGPTP
jgi:hypothetical protein